MAVNCCLSLLVGAPREAGPVVDSGPSAGLSEELHRGAVQRVLPDAGMAVSYRQCAVSSQVLAVDR